MTSWPLTVTMGSTAQVARVAEAIDGLAPEVVTAAVGTAAVHAPVAAAAFPAGSSATLDSFVQEQRAIVRHVRDELDAANAALGAVHIEGRSIGIGGARVGSQRFSGGSRDAAVDALEHLKQAEAARARGEARGDRKYVSDATGHSHDTFELRRAWELVYIGSDGGLYSAIDALELALVGETPQQLRHNVGAAVSNASAAVQTLGLVSKRLDSLQTAGDEMVAMDRAAQVRRAADDEVRALPVNSAYLQFEAGLRGGEVTP